MLVTTFLHKVISRALPQVHTKRMAALFDAIEAVVQGAPLSLTSLGRSLTTKAQVKHNIKKVDRLLGNIHLQKERIYFYQWMTRVVLSKEKQPVILVDWSHADDRKKFFILRASLVTAGRSVPLFESAHHCDNEPAFHRKFIRQLQALMPKNCQPIIVTDAGFRRTWFTEVESLGWHYVGRMRNRELFMRPNEKRSFQLRWFYRQATTRATDLGTFEMTKHRFTTRVCLLKKQATGRVHSGRLGKKAKDSRSKQCAKRERDPWLLVTNLPSSWRAKQIAKLYALRMRIEEGFRDLKSVRYGMGFRFQASQSSERINILLLIAAIGLFATYLCGRYVKDQNKHRQYQANTSKETVLSLVSLGRQWLRRRTPISYKNWRKLMEQHFSSMSTCSVLS